MIFLYLIVILLPLCAGAALALMKKASMKAKYVLIFSALAIHSTAVAVMLFLGDGESVTLFKMTEILAVSLKMDGFSKIFLLIASFGFLLAGIYAVPYMAHSERADSFFSFYLLSLGALSGMDLSANLITMYLFFEAITLLSMPLVLHDRTAESVRAALKYLFYSVAGAFLALCAIFFLAQYASTLDFTPGGALDPMKTAGRETLLRVVIFLGIVGFGAKAGMYPLHGWLPTAHPVAPAPASAVLSGIIAKAGVLAILRLLYFSVGSNFLFGTWVQYALCGLALLTVFMGSMMAYREKNFKKRLAYSSVSQISYVLTGLFLMVPEAAAGGMLHIVFHACIKLSLFMVAGSFIVNTGAHDVDEFTGFGKSMPKTLWFFTLSSLSLVGIPPAAGFISKWYLATGSLDSGVSVISWLAPVILLVSALLTAGYLLPITIRGFFPGKGAEIPPRNSEGGAAMWLPIGILSAASILLGIFSTTIVNAFMNLANSMF